MAIDSIFPVVVARDAAATIELTLASLREFPEVIVCDLGADHATAEICAAYPNVQRVDGEFLGGGRTRNHAASLAVGDWILAIDPGEYLSDALLASLRTIALDDANTAYALDRHKLLMGREVRWGGWGHAWIVRLYNRHCYQFNDAPVDEKLVLGNDARVATLKGTLWQEAAPSLDALVGDIGLNVRLRQHALDRPQPPLVIALRSVAAFLASYVVKLGMLEGWRGLVIAAVASAEVFFGLMQRHATEPHTRRGPGWITNRR